jgi:hypothetical protein
MSSRRIVAVLLLLGLPLAASAATRIVRVWTSYRTADSFKRVSEYLGGTEDNGNETVFRSQPAQREGYYFLIRTKSDAAIAGAKITLEVDLPGAPEPKTFVFAGDVPATQRVFHLGVTGTDWPNAKVRPAAWRIAVRGPDGAVLASEHSFLWSGSDGR